MARLRRDEGFYEEATAKPDVFLALVITTFMTSLVATVVMWLEYRQLL